MDDHNKNNIIFSLQLCSANSFVDSNNQPIKPVQPA
jgi:hypothetical protein